MAEKVMFLTQRSKIMQAYQDAGQPFNASTKPYKSTVSFTFNVVNQIDAATVAWYISPAGVPLTWFGYKLNDVVPSTGAQVAGTVAYRAANEADTNISKARTTNGAEDFVIEGMSASCRSVRAGWNALGGTPADISDPTIANCLLGNNPIYDPAALYLPPQVQSPFNLEMGLFRHLGPYVAVEFEWDRSRIVKMGTLDQIPEGAANSYLRASGEPSTNDRYRIPEGYIWRREGEPDSEFIVRGTLQDSLCVPTLQVATPQTSTVVIVVTPAIVNIDVVLRLHGLSVKLPTRN
jgi:hypothetical protein